jgi:low temperature requirement protein LtrA
MHRDTSREAALTTPSARRRPSLSVPLRERETVRPLELFFDLVFVLGFTQCTALMSDQPTWSGIGRAWLHEILAHPAEPLDSVHSFALLGGTAIYLLAHVALRLRNAHTINIERLVLAVVLLAVIPAAVHVDALVTIGALNLLLWAMIAYETFFVYDERRDRLRHGLEVDVPGAEPG